jgi:hypothetical protein
VQAVVVTANGKWTSANGAEWSHEHFTVTLKETVDETGGDVRKELENVIIVDPATDADAVKAATDEATKTLSIRNEDELNTFPSNRTNVRPIEVPERHSIIKLLAENVEADAMLNADAATKPVTFGLTIEMPLPEMAPDVPPTPSVMKIADAEPHAVPRHDIDSEDIVIDAEMIVAPLDTLSGYRNEDALVVDNTNVLLMTLTTNAELPDVPMRIVEPTAPDGAIAIVESLISTVPEDAKPESDTELPIPAAEEASTVTLEVLSIAPTLRLMPAATKTELDDTVTSDVALNDVTTKLEHGALVHEIVQLLSERATAVPTPMLKFEPPELIVTDENEMVLDEIDPTENCAALGLPRKEEDEPIIVELENDPTTDTSNPPPELVMVHPTTLKEIIDTNDPPTTRKGPPFRVAVLPEWSAIDDVVSDPATEKTELPEELRVTPLIVDVSDTTVHPLPVHATNGPASVTTTELPKVRSSDVIELNAATTLSAVDVNEPPARVIAKLVREVVPVADNIGPANFRVTEVQAIVRDATDPEFAMREVPPVVVMDDDEVIVKETEEMVVPH